MVVSLSPRLDSVVIWLKVSDTDESVIRSADWVPSLGWLRFGFIWL